MDLNAPLGRCWLPASLVHLPVYYLWRLIFNGVQQDPIVSRVLLGEIEEITTQTLVFLLKSQYETQPENMC